MGPGIRIWRVNSLVPPDLIHLQAAGCWSPASLKAHALYILVSLPVLGGSLGRVSGFIALGPGFHPRRVRLPSPIVTNQKLRQLTSHFRTPVVSVIIPITKSHDMLSISACVWILTIGSLHVCVDFRSERTYVGVMGARALRMVT